MISVENAIKLPGLNCGSCGYPSCDDFSVALKMDSGLIKRCIHLKSSTASVYQPCDSTGGLCAACSTVCAPNAETGKGWKDSLGREYDFSLDIFPNDPGPKETIRLHNPILTRELDIQKGDILIGRPLGMSCGCPVTHCGVAVNVDQRTGIIVWCITGPLAPRHNAFKDIGYYSAEAYEGIVRETKVDLKVGMRYWFMPHKCMMQWRHSGLVNFLNKTSKGLQIRLEGLLIG